jgi:polar amino acid transport system substrate-binding protein
MDAGKMLRLYAVIMVFLLPAISQGYPLKKIQIYTFENPPLVMKTGEGVEGLSGDYGKIVAEAIFKSGKQSFFEIVWLPYKRGLRGVETDPQGLFFALDRNAERESKFNWVMELGQVDCWLYAVNSYVKINSLWDLRKYRVGVQGGSAREAEVRRYMGASTKVEALADDNANLRKLHAGRIDIWATRPMVMESAQKALKAEKKWLRDLIPLKVLFKQHLWMMANRNMPEESRELVQSVFGWDGKKPVKSPALSARDVLKTLVLN